MGAYTVAISMYVYIYIYEDLRWALQAVSPYPNLDHQLT